LNNKLADEFFEALGEPKLEHPFSLIDAYRFNLCYQHLLPGSVLDVGAYMGDFLKLAQKDGREAYGSEINQARISLVNSILGSQLVKLGFRNGNLDDFDSDSVDNVVCMETVEHIIDDKYAISELCRVAGKRVIVTVPYRERVEQILCTHCNEFTPNHGHQHSYDKGSFAAMLPPGWQVLVEYSFANRITRMIRKILPESRAMIPIMSMVDRITPGSGRWLMIVLDSNV